MSMPVKMKEEGAGKETEAIVQQASDGYSYYQSGLDDSGSTDQDVNRNLTDQDLGHHINNGEDEDDQIATVSASQDHLQVQSAKENIANTQKIVHTNGTEKKGESNYCFGFPKEHLVVKYIGLFVSIVYICFGLSMTILNKTVVSIYDFKNPNIFLSWQNIVTVLLMFLRRGLGWTYFEWNTKTAWIWIVPTIFYVSMLSTSVLVLQYLKVHMVNVFKNITLILIALGDSYFFKAKNGLLVQTAFSLMFSGSMFAAITDLEFNFVGYFWMVINVFSQAAYVLYVRKVKRSINLPEEQMVYYNNLLSIPFFLTLAFFNGEYERAQNSDCWKDNGFIIVWVVSGFMGLLICLASFYCMNIVGPTAFAIVNAVNKIPLSIISFFFFDAPADWKNIIIVTCATVAAIIYSKAKYDEQIRKKY